jgi:glycosyltransferase involved in cell wall biosynthesis
MVLMSTDWLVADPDTESLTAEMATLRQEIRAITRELAHIRAEVYRGRRRRGWEYWVRRILNIRLGCYEQYAPRPLQLPTHYQDLSSVRLPVPTISIVTPAFNHGHFLERTLLSVLNQGYPQLEYIIQDGGSRDETVGILDRYRERLHRAVSSPDRGQTHALNLGFAHASGEIMAYLNSDDVLLPGSLSYVVRYFQDHPEVDLVYGHRIFIDSRDEEVGRWVLPPHSNTMLMWADYVPQETMFWRRRIWDRIGGHFDETFSFAVDWDVLLRFRQAGATMVRLPRFLGAFRVHDEQKSQAQLSTVGEREMTRLRRRCHGRDVARSEIRRGILGYLLRHALYNRLYWWGLLRY